MNKLLLFLMLMHASLMSLCGQITLTNATFPTVGDTLKTSISTNPGSVNLQSPGENLFWDFSMVQAQTDVDLVFAAASEGVAASEFPTADLVSFIPPSNERYISVSGTEVAELGFVGLDPIVNDFSVTTFYSPPYVLQRAPVNYLDVTQDQTQIVTAFLFDSLPQAIKDLVSPFQPDSVRVIVTIEKNSEVDAWGKVKIPAGTFDVLREKTIENRSTSVWAYTGFFGWSEVTATIRTALPDPSLLDPVENEAYVFRSNDKKEPIATIALDSMGNVDRIQMLRNISVGTYNPYQSVTAFLSPNPTYGRTFLVYGELPEGRYDLTIYDIIGNELSTQQYYLNGSGEVKCDFTQLSKGTYLYSLKDLKGNVITTKRLVILNP